LKPGLAAWGLSAAAGLAAGVLAAVLLGGPIRIGASVILAVSMAAIAIEDARRLRVPDSWNLVAALTGITAVALQAQPGLWPTLTAIGLAALQAAICGGAFLLVREVFFRLRGVEGLGFGDVKLAATAGIWLGWQLFAVTVTLAALATLLWVALQTAASRGWPADRKIPLGAFLAPAIWVCWFGVAYLGAASFA
jgi:leader peptidase (prepilin peptidase)/N-methyltransferase